MSENSAPLQDVEASRGIPDERLRLVEAASGVGTFVLDFAADRWDLGPQAALLFGFDPARVPGSFPEWERVIFPDDVAKLHAAAVRAKETGTYAVEFRVRLGDGNVRWIAGKGTAARAHTAEVGQLYGAFFDITERKALEARLLALNETLESRISDRSRQLEESERRFGLLVQAVSDYAIFMLDTAGHIASWNAGAERINGYTRDEIIGRHFSVFYTEEDRQNDIPRLALATAEQEGRYHMEVPHVRKDGTRFISEVSISPIRDAQETLLGFAKITHDITEKQALAERMRQMQKMEVVGQLTGGVAHDFNNLLTVISGNVESIKRRLAADDTILWRFANAALHGVERAALLIDRLLVFSRRQALEPKSLSVNGEIARFSEVIRRALPESVDIETVLGSGVWPIVADANQLENALLNLAINARDAMPDGGKLTIEAANIYLDEAYAAGADLTAGQYVCISVSDTGTGMSEETVSRAFEPFFTTKEPGRGTGLGLSQVYGFVKQSGGQAKIYSEIGSGTTIKLYFPRDVGSAAAEDVKRPATAAVPRGKGEVVLVVEDDADVRHFTVEALRELGYSVIEAVDGPTALRLLDANRETRLLFTDVGLPGGMNGRQLADEAKRRRLGLKVLYTSGYARNAIVHHGRLDPGVELISKPFTYPALAARVRAILDAK